MADRRIDLPDGATRGDVEMMDIALRLARRGLGRTAPNPSVGAIVVEAATGEVVARAVTAPGGRPHAEPQALVAAGPRARGATLYVTLEPCSHHGRTAPCSDAVVAAGVARCVVAIEDPDPRVAGRGLDRLRAAGIEVVRGVRAEAAHWLTRGHIVRVTERRPFVQLKIATGPAGEVPRGGGAPVFVTGPEARARGHLMRAEADAILVGAGTVRDDDPDLTCRLPGLADRSPVRVVLAGETAGLAASRLARTAAQVPVIVFVPADATGAASTDMAALTALGVEVRRARTVAGRLWLPDVLESLAAGGVTRLLVEGGPSVWRSFVRRGLLDEVVLFLARGGREARDVPLLRRAETALTRAAGLIGMRVVDSRPVGADDMLVLHATAGAAPPAVPMLERL